VMGATDPIRESDAAYLGRLQASLANNPNNLRTVMESLKNGNADAQRRYQLAIELGYISGAQAVPGVRTTSSGTRRPTNYSGGVSRIGAGTDPLNSRF